MANTPNFNWLLPTVGGSNDTWGRILNQFAGANNLDTQLYSIASSNIGNTAPELPTGPTPGPGVIWLNDTNATWPLQIYDGTDWVEIGALDPANHTFTVASAIKSTKATVFSTAGANTYTPNAKLIFANVQLVGAGGGGGLPSIGSGGSAAGAGGGGGQYVSKTFLASVFNNVNQPIVIGAGGVAGTASALSAGTGGTSTFGVGTLLTAVGGGGAVDFANTGYYGVVPGLGGTGGTGGEYSIDGQCGGTWATTIGGVGGASFLGAGGRGWYNAPVGGVIVARPGTQGGGGGGGSNGQAGSSAAGGPGYCVIVEYLSA